MPLVPEKLCTPLILVVRSSINQRVVHGLYTPLFNSVAYNFSLLVLLRLPGVLLSCFGVLSSSFSLLVVFCLYVAVLFHFAFVLFCFVCHIISGKGNHLFLVTIVFIGYFFSTRRHPAHPVSALILHPGEIQALWSPNYDTGRSVVPGRQ